MIRLFKPKTPKTDLIQYNGDCILDKICYSAVVTEELNGEFSLNLKVVITDKGDKDCYDLLVEGALLVVNDEYGDEYFRIASVDKDLDEIEIYARQITISDTLTMWLEDVRPTKQNGNIALNWIFDNAVGGNKWFGVSSNIKAVTSATYDNKTVYEAISTSDNCFLKRWGGEIERRGFNIKINDKIGEDRGVIIRSRKNLIGFEASTNINELTTRIYPKGYNGITINEKYIDSDNISKYPKIYSREYKFDDIRVNDENYTEGFETLEEAQNEIKRRCKNLFLKEKIDTINAKYNVNFVDLRKTEEYKNYSILEFTKIGDVVTVIEERLNVNINVRVLKREYDVLNKKRISTVLTDKDLKEKNKIPEYIQDELNKRPTSDQVKDEINAGIADRPTNFEVDNKIEVSLTNRPTNNELEQAFEEEMEKIQGILKNYPTIGEVGEQLSKLPSIEDIRETAKDIATSLLNAGIKNSNVIVKENEILIMDTKDVNTAQKVWRYNVNGLGYSSTGYYGRYETAITMDGSIVADFINTGTINADLIRTGTINADLIKTGTINADLIKAGIINASLIKTGVINAELIKSGTMLADRIRGGKLVSLDGSCSINLGNGNVEITKGSLDASMIKTGEIKSKNNEAVINLNDGKIKFTKGLIEGKNQTINLNDGYTQWRHSAGGNTEVNAGGFFRNGKPFLTLITTGTGVSGGSAGAVPRTVRVKLPDEFKGRLFNVICQTVDTQGGIEDETMKRIHLEWGNVNHSEGTFDVTGYWISYSNGYTNEKELQWSYMVVGG